MCGRHVLSRGGSRLPTPARADARANHAAPPTLADMSELLTVGQAATLAGVSVRTMRRRVAAGEVVTAGHGQAQRIVAASVVAAPPGDPASGGQDRGTPAALTEDMTEDRADVTAAMSEDTTATPSVMAGLVAVVDRLTLENRELVRQLVDVSTAATVWQQRASTLADRLDRAESKLLGLAAPRSPPGDRGRGAGAAVTAICFIRTEPRPIAPIYRPERAGLTQRGRVATSPSWRGRDDVRVIIDSHSLSRERGTSAQEDPGCEG